MNQYEDNHPLAKPVHDADVMINAATFFMEIQVIPWIYRTKDGGTEFAYNIL